jgi:broad specificity phosphatase PhoE
LGRIGGDSKLSKRGRVYAQALGKWMKQQPETKEGLKVWCSTLKRTIETASYVSDKAVQWRALAEIEVGVCDGMVRSNIIIRFNIYF